MSEKLKTLIIDTRTPSVAPITAMRAEFKGYKADVAMNIETAKSLLNERDYDAVWIDNSNRRKSGRDSISIAMEIAPHIDTNRHSNVLLSIWNSETHMTSETITLIEGLVEAGMSNINFVEISRNIPDIEGIIDPRQTVTV